MICETFWGCRFPALFLGVPGREKGGFPEGVEKFKSKISKDAQYKFEIPGIYAYWCTPHKGMGMIGFVVVGNDKSNLEAIKKIKYLGKSKKISQELIGSL